VLKLRWTAKKAERRKAGTSVAGERAVPEPSVG